MKNNTANIVEIEGGKYYTVKAFASLIDRTENTVYRLINKGNSQRKLRAIKFSGALFIPIEELSEFPFTMTGPKPEKRLYHRNNLGAIEKRFSSCSYNYIYS